MASSTDVQNITDTTATIVYTLDTTYPSATDVSAYVAQGGTTVFTGTVAIPAGSVEGDTVSIEATGLSPNTASEAYGSIASEPVFPSKRFVTKATGYNDPRTATQSQWEDLATRVKAKADSSDVPSTYWGQTASNGTVTGDLTLNTHAAHGDAKITSGSSLQDGVSVSLTAGGSHIVTARSYTDVQSQVSISTIELGGTIDAGFNKINNLAAGTASTDAVNKSQLDAKPTITMTSTDPGEGAALAANNYVAVYGGDPIIMDYSTSEINTGAKWIDGSTIYKKTINFGALPNATYKTVAHQISNVSRFIKIEQSITNTGGTGALALSSGQASNNDFNFYVTDTNIGITTSGDRSTCNAYITLYYTKSS